jgi:hypothetical protein
MFMRRGLLAARAVNQSTISENKELGKMFGRKRSEVRT